MRQGVTNKNSIGEKVLSRRTQDRSTFGPNIHLDPIWTQRNAFWFACAMFSDSSQIHLRFVFCFPCENLRAIWSLTHACASSTKDEGCKWR